MKDVFVTESIKYIGVDDREIDLFESQYIVPNGVSYNSYVIIDNSDNANLGNYDNVSDAIKDADDYAYRNKYGSYSVVGCVDGEYDLDDTSVIYTADKDNLYESILTPRERKAEELRSMKVYGERLPEEEIENLLDEFEDDYDYLTQDNLETMYYYDAKDNGLTL